MNVVQILIRHLLKCVLKITNIFLKAQVWGLFQKNAVCDAGASCTADPNPVLYQGKWKMLPIICEHFHYKVNRIYKLFENEENNLQLLEVFLILLWFYINFSPHNSLSSKKKSMHSIRANCFLQASSAKITAVRGKRTVSKSGVTSGLPCVTIWF